MPEPLNINNVQDRPIEKLGCQRRNDQVVLYALVTFPIVALIGTVASIVLCVQAARTTQQPYGPAFLALLVCLVVMIGTGGALIVYCVKLKRQAAARAQGNMQDEGACNSCLGLVNRRSITRKASHGCHRDEKIDHHGPAGLEGNHETLEHSLKEKSSLGHRDADFTNHVGPVPTHTSASPPNAPRTVNQPLLDQLGGRYGLIACNNRRNPPCSTVPTGYSINELGLFAEPELGIAVAQRYTPANPIWTEVRKSCGSSSASKPSPPRPQQLSTLLPPGSAPMTPIVAPKPLYASKKVSPKDLQAATELGGEVPAGSISHYDRSPSPSSRSPTPPVPNKSPLRQLSQKLDPTKYVAPQLQRPLRIDSMIPYLAHSYSSEIGPHPAQTASPARLVRSSPPRNASADLAPRKRASPTASGVQRKLRRCNSWAHDQAVAQQQSRPLGHRALHGINGGVPIEGDESVAVMSGALDPHERQSPESAAALAARLRRVEQWPQKRGELGCDRK